MTFCEAFRESMRRNGISEEEIETRVTFAQGVMQLPPEKLNAPIQPGHEEKAIAELVEMGKVIMAHRDVLKPIFDHTVARRSSKN